MLKRRNLDHVRKDPTIILTLRCPIDEELLLAFELMPELIEQYENIPASVQNELGQKPEIRQCNIQRLSDHSAEYSVVAAH
ncbi:MAG: hypothetical protein ACHQM6_10900 [Candidatus Kapaibacterium sp.]